MMDKKELLQKISENKDFLKNQLAEELEADSIKVSMTQVYGLLIDEDIIKVMRELEIITPPWVEKEDDGYYSLVIEKKCPHCGEVID